MSLTAACAPVPLTGQSSMTWPALRSARSARRLSSRRNVLVSTTILSGSSCAVIAATVASSACALGRLRISTGAAAASALASRAKSTPARAAARRRPGAMSKPTTRQPAAARCRAKAPPMVPRPMIPTVPLVRPAIGFLVESLGFAMTLSRLRPASYRHPNRLSFGSGDGNRQEVAHMQVGVAGLGRMGAAIAARLIETGNEGVVWNRSPEKSAPLAKAGARIAADPAELAQAAEATLTIVTDTAAIDAIYGGPSGLLSGSVD